jgi:hypothetical protein
MVDQQGLNTWKVDSRAMVQAAGGNWRPLKDLLAMQQAAAKYAEQNDPTARPLPLVPPPPKGEKFPRPATPRPTMDAVAAPAPVVVEPAPVLVLPEEPVEAIAEAVSPEPATDEGPPISPADFRENEELAPVPDAFAPGEAPGLNAAEPLEPQAWVDEPEAAIFTTAAEAVSASAAVEEVAAEDEFASLPPPEPTDKSSAWDPEPSQWSDAVEPSAPVAPRAIQTLADDPIPRQGHSDEHFAYGGSPSYTSRASSAGDDAYSYAASEPGFEEEEPDDFLKPRPIVLDERVVRVLNVVGVLLSRSLDLLDRVSGQTWQALSKAWASRAANRPAPIPREIAREEPRTSFVEAEPEPEPPKIQALADEPSDSAYGDAPRYDDTPPRPIATEDLPLIPLKPLETESSTALAVRSFVQRLGAGISAWAVSLRARVEGLVRRYRAPSESSRPWSEPSPSSSTLTLGISYEPPREPVKRPPSTSEIPVLRLAKIDEPEEQGDMYEGPTESPYFPTAWLWTKRLAWTTLFAVGSFLVYQNWEAWSPKATGLSTTAFTEVARYTATREQRVREQQALVAATEQLPHLTPDTIRLVISSSSSGVPDPSEVFQIACNAADRGLPALTLAEREELSALRQALLAALSPAERVLLREYDDVRARRMPFSFEDKSALDHFARGARGMPAESRDRLQVLLGEAIAGGLASTIPDRPATPPSN